MYLSKLILNPRSRDVHRDLRSHYDMHRTLLKALPDNLLKGQRRGVLWRVDTVTRKQDDCDAEQDTLRVVFVQTDLEPDWSKLPNGYFADSPDVRPRDESFRIGQRLAFRLRANPTKRVKESGKRIGLLDESEQLEWMRRREFNSRTKESRGFRILSVRATPYRVEHGEKNVNGKSHHLIHVGVTFDGLLEVTDPVKFKETVQRGIGPGKAFGFGLLSLARVK